MSSRLTTALIPHAITPQSFSRVGPIYNQPISNFDPNSKTDRTDKIGGFTQGVNDVVELKIGAKLSLIGENLKVAGKFGFTAALRWRGTAATPWKAWFVLIRGRLVELEDFWLR